MTNQVDTAPHRMHNLSMESQRIISKAVEVMQAGVPAFTAIEIACRMVGKTSGGRESARRIFTAAAARVERGEG